MKKMTTIAIAAMVVSSLAVIPAFAEAAGRVDAGAGDGQTVVVDSARSAVVDADSVLMVDGQDGSLAQVIFETEMADYDTEMTVDGESVIISVSGAPGAEDASLVVKGQDGSVE
ncbi:MAG: hypothetical protein KHZ58_03465 [Hungatella hathewayi]|nr:hypothetical protein [Hungatella hathewayi]